MNIREPYYIGYVHTSTHNVEMVKKLPTLKRLLLCFVCAAYIWPWWQLFLRVVSNIWYKTAFDKEAAKIKQDILWLVYNWYRQCYFFKLWESRAKGGGLMSNTVALKIVNNIKPSFFQQFQFFSQTCIIYIVSRIFAPSFQVGYKPHLTISLDGTSSRKTGVIDWKLKKTYIFEIFLCKRSKHRIIWNIILPNFLTRFINYSGMKKFAHYLNTSNKQSLKQEKRFIRHW